MKHKFLSMIAVMTMLVPSILVSPKSAQAIKLAATTEPEPSISILLDGYPLQTNPEPIVYNERTMVPFRAIADVLGVSVSWDAATRTVIARDDKKEIRLQIGNKTATVDGKEVPLDAEPILYKDYTLIPLRFLADSIGAEVGWDDTKRMVSVQSQPRHLNTLMFYGLGSYSKRFYLPKFDQASFTWSELDANGRLAFDQGDYQWPQSGADELLSEVKASGVATTLMVSGNDDKGVLTKMFQDDALQTKFINDLVAKVNEQGLGGATLDLEDWGPSIQGYDLTKAQTQYADFVKKVADALHADGKKLIVCVSPLNAWYKGYDYAKLAQSADQLFVMAYDYHVQGNEPQPNEYVDGALQMATAVVDPKKLILGINFFNENDESIREKVGLAKRYQLGGVGFWILPMVDDGIMQTLDDSLILRKNTLQEPPTTGDSGDTGTAGTTGTGAAGSTSTSGSGQGSGSAPTQN